MILKCSVCNKEFEALRPTKRTCSDTCRQKYHRNASIVTKIIPIVTKKDSIVTGTVTSTPTVTVTVTERVGDKKLRFTKDMPMEERIKKYREMYPDSDWVPNWVAHGFLSMEDAINNAIKCVNKNQSIIDTGLSI